MWIKLRSTTFVPIFVVINYQSFYFDTTMTRLVVKTVKICALKFCAPKFLKNGVCFVLFWQHHWKMIPSSLPSFLTIRSASDFWQHHWKMIPLSLPSSLPSFLTIRSASDFRRRNYRRFWLLTVVFGSSVDVVFTVITVFDQSIGERLSSSDVSGDLFLVIRVSKSKLTKQNKTK